jgi:hypothetical protein
VPEPGGQEASMTTDYQIQGSSRKCCVSGRELRSGEKYYSVLLDLDGKLLRQDYSVEVWKGPPERSFSFWMGTIAAPESRRRPTIDDEMLMDCCQRLDGQTEPGKIRFRYIVALLLMRRRRFKFEESRQDVGQEILVLRCTRTGAETQVINPCLTEEEMGKVQEEVLQALGWE